MEFLSTVMEIEQACQCTNNPSVLAIAGTFLAGVAFVVTIQLFIYLDS